MMHNLRRSPDTALERGGLQNYFSSKKVRAGNGTKGKQKVKNTREFRGTGPKLARLVNPRKIDQSVFSTRFDNKIHGLACTVQFP